MTLLKRAGLALACLMMLAPAQALAQKKVAAPGTIVPQTAICVGAPGEPCVPLTAEDFGGGPGGDATAAKQDEQTAHLAAIEAAAENPDPVPIAPVACSIVGYQSAASTNATNTKSSAATLCGGVAINTTATLYYLRLYNLATAPTCSSATGFVATIPIPASTSGNGTAISVGAAGVSFATGLGFCLTGGPTSTDNTNAATGVFVTLAFK